MRIGIDGTCWLNRRGYGRFAHRLIAELAALDGGAEYAMVVDFDPAEAPPIPEGVRLISAAAGVPAARAAGAAGRRSLADMWAVSRALSRESFDIIFFPTAYTYVPVAGSARVVVVIHDVIAEQFPQHVFPSRLSASFWRLKLWAARRQADLVVTVSEASRRGLARHFGLAPERIVVVPEAADPLFRRLPDDDARRRTLRRFGLRDEGFVLYVGGISPHKNLGALIQAFADARRQLDCTAQRLVLVGDYSGDVFYSAYAALRRQADDLRLDEAVLFTGYVPDEDLVHLYNAAAAFVLPSLLEGFGLPAIEALACGAPVVASNRGALPEVVGAAGILFDPDASGALRDALQRVCGDAELREHLRAAGPRRAAEFSWQRAARVTHEAFQQLSEGRR
jgi:glycosyltransferase involved in cell wall biosynthesis